MVALKSHAHFDLRRLELKCEIALSLGRPKLVKKFTDSSAVHPGVVLRAHHRERLPASRLAVPAYVCV